MGGSLGGVFSNVGAGANGAPSFLQSLVHGTVKGAGTGLGKSMQQQGRPPMPGSGGSGTPSATPVDSGYFTPTVMPPGTAGVRPGTPPPGAGASPFYAQ